MLRNTEKLQIVLPIKGKSCWESPGIMSVLGGNKSKKFLFKPKMRKMSKKEAITPILSTFSFMAMTVF